MTAKRISSAKDRKTNSSYKPFVPAVEQASRVLICLANSPRPNLKLTQICSQLGIHKSKGYSILNTLKAFGFVEKDSETKRYSLGTGLLFLARRVLDNLDLRDAAAPFLKKLARETQGTALLGLLSADQVFIVAKHENENNIGVNIRLGHRFHVTSGSHGKAIVAFMPDEESKRVLERKKLYFYGDPSEMSMKRLKRELLQCRQQGFAADFGKLQHGINAVSAPIILPKNRVIGCVILIGTYSEDLITSFGAKTAETARQITHRIGGEIKLTTSAHVA
jgi:IclR family KDG regulon transcriptional repressor